MKKLFTIGEVSKIKGVTIKALRYYHKMDILKPKYIDNTTGYRYYSIEQFIYIDIIKGARALGTSIVELQDIFKACDTDKLLMYLEKKKIEAEDNINKMNEIIKNIDLLSYGIKQSKSVLENEAIEIKYFDKRYIIVVSCKEYGELKELMYYSELDNIIKENNLEANINKGIIYNIVNEEEVDPIYVFSEIKENKSDNIKEHIKILPEGRYLTLSYDEKNESLRKEKLSKYLNDNCFKVSSFIEIDLFNDLFNVNSYSCQLQIFLDNNKITNF